MTSYMDNIKQAFAKSLVASNRLPDIITDDELDQIFHEVSQGFSNLRAGYAALATAIAKSGITVSPATSDLSRLCLVAKTLMNIGLTTNSTLLLLSEATSDTRQAQPKRIHMLHDGLNKIVRFRHVDFLNLYFDFWELGMPTMQDLECAGVLPGGPTGDYQLKNACWKFSLTYSTNGRTIFRYSRKNGVIEIRFKANAEEGEVKVVQLRDCIPALVLLRHVHMKEGIEARDRFLLEQGYMLKSPLPGLTSSSST